MNFLGHTFRKIDEMVLYQLHLRIPDSLEPSAWACLPFETVLAETQINVEKTAVSALTTSGEHPVWIGSLDEEMETRVSIRRAPNPNSPLIIYHHGLNEYPYTSSWRRIFDGLDDRYHLACIQAPYHDNYIDPIAKGWATVNRMYQLFSGSLRMIELVKNRFEQEGAEETILVGLSWGGLTAMLYEGIFQDLGFVVPMMSSPNLARVLIDSAELFNRPVSVPDDKIYELLDLTPYFERISPYKMHPLLGRFDGFFRFDSHVAQFEKRPLRTISRGHLSTIWPGRLLREHVLSALEEAARKRVRTRE
ncbi:MAG: hypothetical protein AAF490_32750 [Chloroflexota bacterium]